MKQENPAGRLNTRLWLSVTLYAGLIVLHQFLIQPALIRLMSDAPAINIAGRQPDGRKRLIEVSDREVRSAPIPEPAIDQVILSIRAHEVASDGHRVESALVGQVTALRDEFIGVFREEHLRVHEQPRIEQRCDLYRPH